MTNYNAAHLLKGQHLIALDLVALTFLQILSPELRSAKGASVIFGVPIMIITFNNSNII